MGSEGYAGWFLFFVSGWLLTLSGIDPTGMGAGVGESGSKVESGHDGCSGEGEERVKNEAWLVRARWMYVLYCRTAASPKPNIIIISQQSLSRFPNPLYHPS